VVIDLICFTAASARQLVEALRPSRPLLVHCGTIWVHGPSLRVPVTEDEPRTAYGAHGTGKADIGGQPFPSAAAPVNQSRLMAHQLRITFRLRISFGPFLGYLIVSEGPEVIRRWPTRPGPVERSAHLWHSTGTGGPGSAVRLVWREARQGR
jgi:hypothetical protein